MAWFLFKTGCLCAGAFCAGHTELAVDPGSVIVTPAGGYLGPARHTYTLACDGFHASPHCP